MPLVSLKEVLDWAEAHNAAVPAFNIDNIDIAQSLMLAAEEEQKPVILAVGQGAIRVGRLDLLASVACIRAGFTSVMFDGSSLPLRENIEQTRLVIKAAHAVGVSVEAELGAIPGAEDGIVGNGPAKVSVAEVEAFINGVDVDALAVSIGNAHGLYKSEPKLDFELLQSIRKLKAQVPHLVLHGGSGLQDKVVRSAIQEGVRKINVATEIRLAYLEGLRATMDSRDIYTYISVARSFVMNVAKAKIQLFTAEEN